MTGAFSVSGSLANVLLQDGQMNFTSTASGNQVNIFGGENLTVYDSTGNYRAKLQPPTNGAQNYNRFCAGNGINSVVYLSVQENNPTIQLSNQPETTYSRSDLTSLYYNNGTIETAKLNATAGTLTLNNGVNNSVLSTSDLTFNSVSLNNTTLRNIKVKQTNTSLQNISQAIYADGAPPTVPTATIINTYSYSPSWYFKNITPSLKINWYFGGSSSTMTVSEVLGLYMYYFNGLTTSNDNTAFFTIYTANDTPSPPNWYKSKRTYIFTQSITPIANTRYCMFMDVSGNCPTPSYYGQTLINMQLSPVGSSNVGAFAPSEVILAFSIGSNSASAVNSVEFCVSSFGVCTENGTKQFNLNPQ